MAVRFAPLLLLPLILVACERVDRPNRPLPEIKAERLDGTKVDRDALIGKPWLINLWVPG